MVLALILWLLSAPVAAQAPAASGELADDVAVDEPEAEPQPQPPDPAVRLVYTGALRGVGSGVYPLAVVSELWRAEEQLDGHLAELSVVHGVAAHGAWTLFAADRRVQTVIDALSTASVQCGPLELRPAVATRTETLVMAGSEPSSLVDHLAGRGLVASQVAWRSCSGGGHEGLVLVGPAELPPSWALSKWELRRGLMGRWAEEEPSRRFVIAAAPLREASRLSLEARRLLAEGAPSLYVDAGSFVDGVSSARNDRLSLHRPLSWKLLKKLEPVALVPGETELIRGAAAFLEETQGMALPYLATNWVAPGPLELPDHRIVTVDTPGGPVRVAFVGILDPALATWIPTLVVDGVELTDPVAATQAVVDRLHAMDEPPDTIVALTTASGEVLSLLRRRLRGVDLLLGDPTFATTRVARRDAELRPLPPGEKGAPLTLSLDGLATADLRFTSQRFSSQRRLSAVTNVPYEVPAELPADPAVIAAVTATRAELYPGLDHALVPAADPERPALAWTEAAWTTLVCQALRDATDADAVLLRELPAPTRIPGPLTELMAVEYIAMLDRVELHRIPGSSLKTVLDKSFGVVPVSCGAEPGASSPKAWGRSIDSARTYRLITTDQTRTSSALGDILDGVPADGPLDPAGVVGLRGAAEQPWTIRAATLQSIRALREDQADPDAAVYAFLDTVDDVEPPEWLLRLRGISAAVSRFQGADQAAFSEVPETLATSPSSFTLATASDVALEHDDPGIFWDLRHRLSYATLATEGSDRQETADDTRLSTSVELPRFAFDAGLTWAPYSELLHDSELTRTQDDTGADNPLQSDLSLTMGLSAASAGPLSELRVGGFASRDLAQFDDKPTEWGGKVELGTSVGVGFLSWSTDSEGVIFADTAQDDASDLRFKVLAESKLAAPLARWLSIGLSAQGFLIQGRVAENDVIDGSWTLGATLNAAGAFELSRR